MRTSVIVVGNPFDGLKIFGPFEDGESAHEWADRNVSNMDWWCVSLDEPGEN